jgi:hypothetical protein
MSRIDTSDARSIRSGAPSGKKFENTLVDTTFTFNKLTKEIQERIKGVNESFNNPVELEKTVQILETSKECYMKVINELNNLFLQDKWGESEEVKLTVESVGSKYLEVMESNILEASAKLKLFHSQQKRQSVTSKVSSRRSSRSTRSGVSKASSSAERQRAIAEAAQKQAQFDILIAEKERKQKELEAVEERRCAEARAKHEHEIAGLKARMKAATAEAKTECYRANVGRRGNCFRE